MYNELDTNNTDVYTEAVFIEGKETVQPLLEDIKLIKDKLMREIHNQENEKSVFVPEKYWRSELFKKFEDDIGSIFGFRNVQIQPYIEKYSSKTKEFETRELNAMVYRADRYPIEGLVTEKGFYDKSKSICMDVYISLGLIKALTPEEILAVFLHEFGHCIDPALMTIRYVETNALSKYLTNRKHKLSRNEKRCVTKMQSGIIGLIVTVGMSVITIIQCIRQLFGTDIKRRVKKIQEQVKNEKSFNRINNSEAYADNFARMYGYGAQLMNGLKKMDKDIDDYHRSAYKRELDREHVILDAVEDALKDVHKTDIHRIHSLMNEYKKDLNDPNIPDQVKSNIKEDMEELDKVLYEYTNNFSEFQSNIYKMIHEELSQKDHYDDTVKSINESYEEGDDKEFVPIFGIIKDYSTKKLRNDGTKKTDDELSSIRFHKIIKFLTRGDNYSHALVSFDSSLTKMYSYEDDGFVEDNIMEVDSWMGTESIYICVMFVSPKDRDNMKAFINNLETHADQTRYASANLLKAYVGKPYKVDKRFVCSSFTGYIMSCANPKNLHRDWSRLRPEDITILPRAFYIMNVKDREDFVKHKEEIDKMVSDIYEQHYDEISDYNNQLPKLMLKDRVDKLKTTDRIWDWIIDRL